MSKTACELLPVRPMVGLPVDPRAAVVIWMMWMLEFKRPLARSLSDR